ncbi:MAG TPA: hypothetical protein VLK78_08990 [Candidatus Angelobacter sp.]|nr:hypothetical protein [Candidatus Angelobacter sp.]
MGYAMLGLISSVIIFNLLCYKLNKKLTPNQTLHMWMFTVTFQNLFDIFIDLKYKGYWYFTKAVDWQSIPCVTVLLPPINVIYLTFYPFKKSWLIQGIYILCWSGAILTYEKFTLLPAPFGYFHYGWWKFAYSCILDPILFIVSVMYYQLIRHIEASGKGKSMAEKG